ncbi:hypothetical protein E5288_WYG019415 [Bos mutus]|uniref:Uncharacterized protein n=1 Tax=Bos mutus TaxID=72004 RepID=A0A6B0RHS3_9CETA|nr:hypothetical protein [Bos mutus]
MYLSDVHRERSYSYTLGPKTGPPLWGMVVLFDRVHRFRRDAHGADKECAKLEILILHSDPGSDLFANPILAMVDFTTCQIPASAPCIRISPIPPPKLLMRD